jgi:hypothetical protein
MSVIYGTDGMMKARHHFDASLLKFFWRPHIPSRTSCHHNTTATMLANNHKYQEHGKRETDQKPIISKPKLRIKTIYRKLAGSNPTALRKPP